MYLFVSSEQIEGIQAVHEFHVWQLAGNRLIASAHIRCHNPYEYMAIAGKVKDLFHKEGIHSTTIQPEFSEVRTMVTAYMCASLELKRVDCLSLYASSKIANLTLA